MDARVVRIGLLLTVLTSTGAVYRTPNFTVSAPTEEIAEQVGKHAEMYRRELAIEWLGHALPRWSRPCPIQVKVGQIGAGGATSFQFDRGEVYGWRMNIQGSLERILDSVLPHEVCHTIFACHFRRPLPRWADEGAATLVEHESERLRQTKLLDQAVKNDTKFPLRELLAMTEYPSDMRRVLTLYAQGYSLADFLIQQGGRSRYLQFLADAHDDGWDEAIHKHYRDEGVEELESRWGSWVMAGSPKLRLPEGSQLAAAETLGRGDGVTVRGQSPDASRTTPSEIGTSAMASREAPDPLAAAARIQRARNTGRAASQPLPRSRSASHLQQPVLHQPSVARPRASAAGPKYDRFPQTDAQLMDRFGSASMAEAFPSDR